MNTSTATTAARAAAEWWAQQIAQPRFNANNPGTIGIGITTAGWLARLSAGQHPVTPEQLADFTNQLEQTLASKMQNGPFSLHTDTDYDPDPIIEQAATAAGIDTARIPWKTAMWIHNDGAITAYAGNGTPERLIWVPDGWDLRCGQIRHERHWDDSGGLQVEYLPQICGLSLYHDTVCGDYQPDTLACATCGASRAEHWNRSDEIGHPFDYGTADGDA